MPLECEEMEGYSYVLIERELTEIEMQRFQTKRGQGVQEVRDAGVHSD